MSIKFLPTYLGLKEHGKCGLKKVIKLLYMISIKNGKILTREGQINRQGTISKKRHQCLAFVIHVLLDSNKKGLNEIIGKLVESPQKLVSRLIKREVILWKPITIKKSCIKCKKVSHKD